MKEKLRKNARKKRMSEDEGDGRSVASLGRTEPEKLEDNQKKGKVQSTKNGKSKRQFH